jgi:hypothetical protein
MLEMVARTFILRHWTLEYEKIAQQSDPFFLREQSILCTKVPIFVVVPTQIHDLPICVRQ